MKAMILAAGRGERLRPLSDSIPKPLLKVGNERLIERHIRQLAAIGIRDIVINVCYMADKIQAVLGNGSAYDVNITYSYEPQALQVGGGILNALPLLGDQPFLLISADIWTSFPLNTLHIQPGHQGHVVLVENYPWHPAGDFRLEDHHLLPKTSLQDVTYTFGSLAIVHPDLFAGFSPGIFSLTPVLEKAAQQKLLTAEVYTGTIFNIGTIADLEVANTFLKGSVA